MEFLKSPKVIFIILVILLLIDFFVIGKLDVLSRHQMGYGFNYPIDQNEQNLLYQRYGEQRIEYNFRHFLTFFTEPPPGKPLNNVWDFFHLDVPPSTVLMNITHFFAFLIFALVLLYIFKLPVWLAFLIGMIFNIFHEYISEGIYVDPSFNDLWTDTIGLMTGALVFVIFLQKHAFSYLNLTQKSEVKSQSQKLKSQKQK